jgi:uncharacterized membrane protein
MSEKLACIICRNLFPKNSLTPFSVLRQNISNEIIKSYPSITSKDFICQNDLNIFRKQYVENLLTDEKGELSVLDKEVLNALAENEVLSQHLEVDKSELTFGNRLSDKLASFGGSWRFIIIFGCIIAIWILINTIIITTTPFDPYPFILLNLILSCLASIQAPVIMMSQNRQEAKDRQRSEHDYRINLKAELEIRHLHEKIDHLLKHQWERLVEIQQVQIEILNEMNDKKKNLN